MSDRSDEELVRAIQSGDIFAFEQLVVRYQRKLQSFVFRMLGDDQSAADVAQESFINLYKTIDRVDSTKKFSSYVFSIARNTALSHIRKTKKEISIEDLEIAIEDESLYQQIVQKEDAMYVRRAVQRLDFKYRRVIQLYYFDDLSYEEISTAMHLPINTIRTHVRRAKDMLRKQLL